jgi:hypothetical protein
MTKPQESVKLAINNPQLPVIEILEWTWGILIISIPAYSGWEHLSKMSQDKPWGLCLTARSKKLQEKPLDLQFNSQDVFGYMLLPKESWLRFNTNVQDSTLSSLYQYIVYPDHFWAAAASFLKTKWINSSSEDRSSKELKTQSPKNKETW